MELRLDKWQVELIEAPVSYRGLIDLTRDRAAVDLHVRNVIEEAGEHGPKLADQIGEILRANLTSASTTLNQLMLVLAASILEEILLEFFENLFSARQDLLAANYSEAGNFLSPVDAAARARLGGPRKFLPRVARISQYAIKPEVAEEVTELIELRNLILHEGALPKLAMADVEDAFHCVHRFLKELGFASQSAHAPVRDRANLLGS